MVPSQASRCTVLKTTEPHPYTFFPVLLPEALGRVIISHSDG